MLLTQFSLVTSHTKLINNIHIQFFIHFSFPTLPAEVPKKCWFWNHPSLICFNQGVLKLGNAHVLVELSTLQLAGPKKQTRLKPSLSLTFRDWKQAGPQKKEVFQPSIFRCEPGSVREGTYQTYQWRIWEINGNHHDGHENLSIKLARSRLLLIFRLIFGHAKRNRVSQIHRGFLSTPKKNTTFAPWHALQHLQGSCHWGNVQFQRWRRLATGVGQGGLLTQNEGFHQRHFHKCHQIFSLKNHKKLGLQYSGVAWSPFSSFFSFNPL